MHTEYIKELFYKYELEHSFEIAALHYTLY